MEQWKDIPGYEGIYQASDRGNIRTAFGKTTNNTRFEKRIWKQRILKQKTQMRSNGRFDRRVSLWKDGKEKTHLVARLIAMAWCDGYSDGMTVNHIDGNPLNNFADNLEWVSLADNIRHGFRTGLYGRNMKCVTLTDETGETISFDSMVSADRYLGKGRGYISNLLKKGRIKTPDGFYVRRL